MGKTTSSRPSAILEIEDSWAAYQLDSAVCTIGLAIENLLHERENLGSDEEPNWVAKYTLSKLLSEHFKVELDEAWEGDSDGLMSAEGIIYDEVR